MLSKKENKLDFQTVAESTDLLGSLLNDVIIERNEEKLKRESVFID